MAIIRAPRPESNFYMLDKQISEDKRLSWGARGLLIYLLGKPDHWTVSPTALVNETKACAKPSGRDSTYGLLRELVTVGYLRRVQNKGDGGKFDSIDYLVSEVARAEAGNEQPHTDSPHTGLPDTAQPHTANPTQVSIEENQGLNGSKDLFGSGDAGAPPATEQKKSAKRKSCRKAQPAPSAAAWEAYRTAYAKRYAVEPLRNAKVNASLKTIVDSVGAEKAPELVTHYLTLTGYYAERQHDIGVLVSDLQKVWNSLNKAVATTQYRKPVTTADFQAIDYRRGINADGSF